MLQSTRETNTPHVFQVDIGLDTPRFPGREVACSTKVVVTADVSTLTDTLSHSSAVTSQSRGAKSSVYDVTPIIPREINWLFISPNGDVIDRTQTGTGINAADPVCPDADGGVFPVLQQAENISEAAASDKEILGNNTLSDQTVKAADLPAADTDSSRPTGVEYRTVGNDTISEYLTVGTNTALRNFVSDSTNTAVMADMTCNTEERRYETTDKYTTTHDHVQCNTITIDNPSVATMPLILRRANSMPSSPELQRTRTNHGTGTCSADIRHAERRQVVTEMPTNIPDGNAPTTYHDSEEFVPERVDNNYGNGHVDRRKQVPAITRQLCTSCLTAIGKQNSVDTNVSDNISLDSHTDVKSDESVNQKQHSTDEDRRQGCPDFTPTGNTDDVLRVTYRDQAVGNDDAFPVVECAVGNGNVWTESRGTGEWTVWTADAETLTPSVAVFDRAIGTTSVRLVHKNEATDNQQTVTVGTSPAEDITSAYRGLLAATQSRLVTVSRGTATPPAPVTADRETTTEHRKLVDCGTSPAVDVTAAYRGVLGAKLVSNPRVTVSRGTLTAFPQTRSVDKDTTTDCTMVDRASSPIKVYFTLIFLHRS